MVKKGIPESKAAFALCRVGDSTQEIDEARDYITRAGYRALPGSVPEKLAYRRASDDGRALTETRFGTLNNRADEVAQAIVDLVGKLTRGKVA